MTSPDDAELQLADVVDRLFGSGLVLAGVMRGPGVADDLRDRIRDVINELDDSIAELRRTVLTTGRSTVERGAAPCETRSIGTLLFPNAAVPAGTAHARRRLRRAADGELFAYAMRGNHFFRVSDNSSWARESRGLLVAARSGVPLARRVGDAFCDLESQLPLYYEDGGAAPEPGPRPRRASAATPRTA